MSNAKHETHGNLPDREKMSHRKHVICLAREARMSDNPNTFWLRQLIIIVNLNRNTLAFSSSNALDWVSECGVPFYKNLLGRISHQAWCSSKGSTRLLNARLVSAGPASERRFREATTYGQPLRESVIQHADVGKMTLRSNHRPDKWFLSGTPTLVMTFDQWDQL